MSSKHPEDGGHPHVGGHPHDELLWQAGQKLAESETAEVSDVDLKAYRRGELTDERQEEIDRVLAGSGEARDRLAALGGVAAATPAPQVREQVLTAFEKELGTKGRVLSWRARPPQQRRRILRGAMALAASLFLAVIWFGRSGPVLPEDLRYQIAASGIAEVRGVPESPEVASSGVVEVYESTVMTIEASPNRSVEDVLVAIFRTADGELQRVDLPEEAVQQVRGAVRIEASARQLVGTNPGVGDLWWVVATGDIPSARELASRLANGETEVLDEHWQAYSIQYRLLASP